MLTLFMWPLERLLCCVIKIDDCIKGLSPRMTPQPVGNVQWLNSFNSVLSHFNQRNASDTICVAVLGPHEYHQLRLLFQAQVYVTNKKKISL